MKHLYTQRAVDEAANKLARMGYTFHELPGSLLAPFVAESPDNNHWNYVFREVYMNEWCSMYSVRKCRKISAAIWKEIATA